jgi:hypothetical protein
LFNHADRIVVFCTCAWVLSFYFCIVYGVQQHVTSNLPLLLLLATTTATTAITTTTTRTRATTKIKKDDDDDDDCLKDTTE